MKFDSPGSRRQALRVKTGKGMHEALLKAREVILSGGIAAIPTESFYALAANAMDAAAVKRLIDLKRRSEGHPILLLISSADELPKYVADIPGQAKCLIERFWPGGLTMVFEAGANISPLLTGNTGKIGIRVSGHPVAREVARLAGVPITGTSANISGKPPCLNAEEVSELLGGGVDLIVDGGQTPGGKGSTILDVTLHPPRILREGMIEKEKLESCLSNSLPSG